MRVLRCDECATIDQMPDWTEGPDSDPYLPSVVEHHKNHHGQLFRLPVGLWLDDQSRRKIIEQIQRKSPLGLAEIDSTIYEVRDQFAVDAMACYNAHQRPKDGCSEFRGSHKQLKPDTAKDRKELGLQPLHGGPKVYLCDWCPVRSVLSQKINDKRIS